MHVSSEELRAALNGILSRYFGAGRQVVRLERDLHKWRARFEFIRNPNGNFAFYFSIFLTSLPDIKIDYDQSTITR